MAFLPQSRSQALTIANTHEVSPLFFSPAPYIKFTPAYSPQATLNFYIILPPNFILVVLSLWCTFKILVFFYWHRKWYMFPVCTEMFWYRIHFPMIKSSWLMYTSLHILVFLWLGFWNLMFSLLWLCPPEMYLSSFLTFRAQISLQLPISLHSNTIIHLWHAKYSSSCFFSKVKLSSL